MLTVLLISQLYLGAFDPGAQNPVSGEIQKVRDIALPNIVTFGGYALAGAGASLLIRSIVGR
ncbi:MAG: hypothetical protein WB539_11915 [Planktothrix agardhii]|uniref:hypothetical protein n=1 Tax=Planktothrix agardhii TaxID=1160 RepID=UPI003C66F991